MEAKKYHSAELTDAYVGHVAKYCNGQHKKSNLGYSFKFHEVKDELAA